MEEVSGVVQGDALEEVLVEQVPEIGGELLVRAVHHRFRPLTEVPPQPEAHAHERRLRRECLGRVSEEPVQRSELANEPRILDVGIVHGPTDQVVVEDVAPDVENPLAEPGAGGRSPVVHDMRRQDRHSSAGGATVAPLQVVPDRALVDDEHRPGLVGVPWVDVIDEPSVEDLVDAGDRRLPCANPFAARRQQAKIVQDLPLGFGLRSTRCLAEPGTVRERAGRLGDLRVRGVGLARAEQHGALGLGPTVRVPPDDPARPRHGARDRRACGGGRGRDRGPPRGGAPGRARSEGRWIGVPALRGLPGPR